MLQGFFELAAIDRDVDLAANRRCIQAAAQIDHAAVQFFREVFQVPFKSFALFHVSGVVGAQQADVLVHITEFNLYGQFVGAEHAFGAAAVLVEVGFGDGFAVDDQFGDLPVRYDHFGLRAVAVGLHFVVAGGDGVNGYGGRGRGCQVGDGGRGGEGGARRQGVGTAESKSGQ